MKNNKKLIRFVESFILMPMIAMSAPSGNMVNIPQVPVLTSDTQVVDQTLATKAKADAIDAYFEAHDMPLAGTGMTMVQEAEKNDLDWRLIAAISVRESTGGKHDCIKADNNPFGWGSCKVSFKSVDEAIATIARNLGGNNPKTAMHYDNKTTLQILHSYNPPSVVPKYAEQVIAIMNAIAPVDMAPTNAANT